MYFISDPWRITFSETKNRQAWVQTGLHQLGAAKEGYQGWDVALESLKAKLDWEKIARVKCGEVVDIDNDMLSKAFSPMD